MYVWDITTFESGKKISGKQPSRPIKDYIFEPTVMFFRMCNSLATFQAMMDSIFNDMIEGCIVIIYMGNILIFSKTQEELKQYTKMVLQRLREHDLFLKPKKCKCQGTPNPTLAPQPLSVNTLCLEAFPSVTFL